MTIRKGEPWGTPGGLPDGGLVVGSDAELARVVAGCRSSGRPVPPIGVTGGDLCRTVGGRGDETRVRSAEGMRLPVDVGVAVIDGVEHVFVAHLVARRSWWRGRVVAVMNAQFLGRWDVAPRSHPNDGRLDVLDVDPAMALGQRWQARTRLASGSHVPHPAITERRVAGWETRFDPPLRVWLDGRPAGRCRSLAVRCEPDALVVVV